MRPVSSTQSPRHSRRCTVARVGCLWLWRRCVRRNSARQLATTEEALVHAQKCAPLLFFEFPQSPRLPPLFVVLFCHRGVLRTDPRGKTIRTHAFWAFVLRTTHIFCFEDSHTSQVGGETIVLKRHSLPVPTLNTVNTHMNHTVISFNE